MDKNTDHFKEQQQIGRSSFIKLNHDPADTQSKKLKKGLINGKTGEK